jgi:hypothetical protein
MERHGSTPDNCFLPLRRAGGRAVRYNPEHFSSEVENAICRKTMPWALPQPRRPQGRSGGTGEFDAGAGTKRHVSGSVGQRLAAGNEVFWLGRIGAS